MEDKKRINLGLRGWILVIYQALAFLTFTAFTNYPLNILSDLYGGAQTISTIYTICILLGIVVQLILSRYIGKIRSVKAMSAIFGILSLVLALCLMLLPASAAWLVCYGAECLFSTLYATFSVGILVGQWFPRRKGTIMGIATFAFPIANGVIGVFAGNVFAKGYPDVFGAFLPFFAICLVGLLLGILFIRDYPEQCGCYRDNDRSMTPEAARKMLEMEIEAKKTSIWTLSNTLKSRDFWFITIPMGALLMCSVGMMTQTQAILGQYAEELAPIGGFAVVMAGICVVACFGSWLLGVLDTKFGTRLSVLISVVVMLAGGILGSIANVNCLLASLFCLAIFMGAGSNFTVSASAQYWRREDFSNVFSCVNPVANILQAIGPMMIAVVGSARGYQASFAVTAVIGVISLIFIVAFRPSHLQKTDNQYRIAAGKQADDVLAGRR